MARIVPYPLLTVSLVLMWMLLNRFSLGHLVLGIAIALAASKGMEALTPSKPRLRRWDLVPRLLVVVLGDIVRSNIAVAGIIFKGKRRERRPGFLMVPLDLRDRTGLAVLAVIITSTPGTAWLDYNSARGTLLIHILDIVDEAEWIDTIKNRYERLLLEIFE